MELEAEMVQNDVPEYLNELIPYRCPKCGNLRRFATLRELRQHLQKDHAFQMGFVKPHSRANIFDKNTTKLSKAKTKTQPQTLDALNHNAFTGETNNNINISRTLGVNLRESSPLLQSFKDEAEVLEMELQLAKQNELKNKTVSMNNLSTTTINEDAKASLVAIKRDTETNHCPKIKQDHVATGVDVKLALDTLNKEVMKSRLNQWVTSDALYRSQDILQGMEQAAENKCKEQRTIVQQLMEDLKNKDEQLDVTYRQHAGLRQERQRLFDETETLVKEADIHNASLKDELNRRGTELESLNVEMDRLRNLSEREMKTKENDLLNSRDKLKRLEWERDRLIEETDRILKRADKDNDGLRNTINAKEQELNMVNQELNQVRWNQQAMLEKTMDVYRKSEESKDMMKTILEAKDDQLNKATEQIERMTGLQKRLVEESQILTDQADENTANMRKLLQLKEGQVKEALNQLQILKEEKHNLEESTSSLAEKAESSFSAIENLKGMVKKKEKDLKTTQSELHDLKSFLQSAAAKERNARSKLETFIEELINRAETAESELRTLRSHSSGSPGAIEDRKPVVPTTAPNIANDVPVIIGGQSHPKRISPQKPPRKKYAHVPGTHRNHEPKPVPRKGLQKQSVRELKKEDRVPKSDLPNNTITTNAEIHYQNETVNNQNTFDINTTSNDDLNSFVVTDRNNVVGKPDNIKIHQSNGQTLSSASHMRALTGDSPHMQKEMETMLIENDISNRQFMADEQSEENTENILRELNRLPPHMKRSGNTKLLKNKGLKLAEPQSKDRQMQWIRVPSDSVLRHSEHMEQHHEQPHSIPHVPQENMQYDLEYENNHSSFSDSEYMTVNNDDRKQPKFRNVPNRKFNSQYELHQDPYLEEQSGENVRARRRNVIHRPNRYKQPDQLDFIPSSGIQVEERPVFHKHQRYRQAKHHQHIREIRGNDRSVDKPEDILRRPRAIGMSLEEEKVVKSASGKRYVKKNGRLSNPYFDSEYPNSHKSMSNLFVTSGHEVARQHQTKDTDRSRRSRSLSPASLPLRIVDQRHNLSVNRNAKSHKKVDEDAEQTDMDYKIGRQKHDHIDDESDASVDYEELLEDGTHDIDGDFNEIMDENGIMWEDNADTLPDVSDSEFDRVSPSGSEAIATKNIIPVFMKNSHYKQYGNGQLKMKSSSTNSPQQHHYKREFEHTIPARNSSRESSTKSDKNLTYDKVMPQTNEIRKSKSELSEHSKSNSKHAKNNGNMKQEGSVCAIRQKVIKHVSVPNLHDDSTIPNMLKTFKPIPSSNEKKNSLSDKDMTSGGREVHRYMVKSPHYNTQAFSNSYTESLGSLGKSSHSSENIDTSHKDDDSDKQHAETLEEKLKRISNKYKTKRSGSSEATSKYNKTAIDDKIKSITDKYRRRRKDIVEGKGVEQLQIDDGYKMSKHKEIPGFNQASKSFQIHTDHRRDGTLLNDPLRSQPVYKSNPMIQQGASFSCPPNAVNDSMATSYIDSRAVSAPQYGAFYDPNHYSMYPNHYLFPMYQQPNQQYGQRYPFPNQGDVQRPDYVQQLPYNYTNSSNNGKLGGKAEEGTINTNDYVVPASNDSKTGIKAEKIELGVNPHSELTEKGSKHSPITSPIKSSRSNQQINAKCFEENKDNDNNRSDYTDSISDRVHLQSPSQQKKASKPSNNYSVDMKESDLENEQVLHINPTSDTESLAEHINTNLQTVSIGGRILQKTNSEEASLADALQINTTENSNNKQQVDNTRLSKSPTELVPLFNEKNDMAVALPSANQAPLASSSVSEGFSLFAEPIEDTSTVGYNSNTQSMIDLRGINTDNTDTDIDTDTESTKHDFFKENKRIKDMFGAYSSNSELSLTKSPRNTMSSASSQASIDYLDLIPTSRREEVKQRRQALSCIFSFLDTAMLCRVAEVCREWRIVSRSAKLWHRVELRNEKISSQFLIHIARRCSQLRVLILADLRPRNRKKSESIEEYQNKIRSSLEAGYEQILKKSEASLHTINIVNCGTLLSSKSLWAASCYSRMLKHVVYLSDFDPVNAEVMWALGSGCRDLKTFRVHPINPCQRLGNFTTRCAQLIGKCFPDLETLSIGGIDVDITAMVFIAKQCQKLVDIELNHMSFVSTEVVENMCQHGLGHLKHVKFVSTPVSPEGISLLHENCNFLEKIYIRLSVCDYFTGIKQKEDLKVYEDEISKYEELKKNSTLAKILKLKVSTTLSVSGC